MTKRVLPLDAVSLAIQLSQRKRARGSGGGGLALRYGGGRGEELEEVVRKTVQSDMQIRKKWRNLGNLATNYLVNYKPL